LVSEPTSAGTSGARWPALAYESLPWHLENDLGVGRLVRQAFAGPYDAAVPPRITDVAVVLPAETAALAEDAATEVARFDAELGAEIAPFAVVLLRSESSASSQIENVNASAWAVAEAELYGQGGHTAALVVANQRAMAAAIALAERIDADAILAMHAALMEQSNPHIAGRWRDDQVWIGGNSLGPHGAQFVPPHHARVPPAIEDLVAFIARDDVPVLSQAALAHAQFETIHPFPDGNGRTGRALVHALLRRKGLTRNVTVPVSAGLLHDVDRYFDALGAYRTGDPAPIVEAFAHAAFASVANGRTLVADLHEIRASWNTVVTARSDAAVWRVADLLVRQPVINAPVVASEVGIGAKNVYRALRPLVEAGVLVEFSDRTRNQLWRAPAVLEALDRFAVRAGRRGRASGPGP
jgi:Fic family protein